MAVPHLSAVRLMRMSFSVVFPLWIVPLWPTPLWYVLEDQLHGVIDGLNIPSSIHLPHSENKLLRHMPSSSPCANQYEIRWTVYFHPRRFIKTLFLPSLHFDYKSNVEWLSLPFLVKLAYFFLLLLLAKQIDSLKSSCSLFDFSIECNCSKGKLLITYLEQWGSVFDWEAFTTKNKSEFQKLLNWKVPSNGPM